MGGAVGAEVGVVGAGVVAGVLVIAADDADRVGDALPGVPAGAAHPTIRQLRITAAMNVLRTRYLRW